MKSFLALLVMVGLVLTGCGGGSSTSTPVNDNVATILSGTAAAGAPIIGQVTVKDSSTPVKSKSALIEANGNYSVDVAGMTAPYVLRAEGNVGGRTYKLHSYAVAEDVGATVNITPFTDLIVANAAGQLAETLFDNEDFSGLTAAEVEAQEAALQAKLQNVLTSLGVDAAVDLLHTAFSANHTALDAVLDMVRVSIETDLTTIQATITNLIDNTSIVDDIKSTTDNTAVLVVVSDLGTVQTSRQAIFNLFTNFSNLFANGLPSTNQLTPFLAVDFLMEDQGRDQFVTELTTDPSLTGLAFSHVVIDALDEAAGTASVTFNVTFSGVTELEPETWQLAKNAGSWQLRGTQEIVERYMDFICDFRTENGTNYKTCGINLGLYDNDFTNNGTGNIPIASAKVTLMRNGQAVPGAVIYMGVPVWGSAGELRIFDNDYSDDFMAFGIGADQFDPSLFQVGDLVQYELFTAALDTATPAVSGSAVATYSTPVMALPISNAATASYPSATQATLDAFNALTTAGGNLNIAWTIPTGQQIDEIAVMVSGGSTWVDVWEEVWSGTSKTVVIDTSSLNSANAPYYTELRVYSSDAQNRTFLRTYIGSTGAGAAPPTPVFTTAMLDSAISAGGKIYLQYPSDADAPVPGTTQENITISGNSTAGYQIYFVQDFFDNSGTYNSNYMASANLTLLANGNLQAIDPATDETLAIWTILSQTDANIFEISGTDVVDSWTDTWYVNTTPAGWLSVGGGGAIGFTAALMDAGPTYYVTYPDGAGNTIQEVFTFSGNGPYTVNFTNQEFDGSGTLVATTTDTVPVTLNADGTLTAGALDDPERTTMTLISTTATYLVVTGVDIQETFTDYWNLSQPAGWL